MFYLKYVPNRHNIYLKYVPNWFKICSYLKYFSKFVVSLHEYTGLLNNNNKYSQKSLSQKTTLLK